METQYAVPHKSFILFSIIVEGYFIQGGTSAFITATVIAVCLIVCVRACAYVCYPKRVISPLISPAPSSSERRGH